MTGLFHCHCGYETKVSRDIKSHYEIMHTGSTVYDQPTLGAQSTTYPTPFHTVPDTSADFLWARLQNISDTPPSAASKASKTQQYMVSLQSIGFQMHPKLKLLICVQCQYAYIPSFIAGHLRGHKIAPKNLDTTLAELVNFFQISANHTTIFPNPNGLAIEGIRVHDGLACTQCDYVCCTNGSADKHNQINHNSVQTPFTPCKAQTLFYPTPRHFFSVTIPKPALSSMTCYDLFADQIQPTIPQLSIGAALSEREISPLLSMTQWHSYLKDWVLQPRQRKLIKSLVRVASSQEPWAKALSKGVEAYMIKIRDIANETNYIVLKKLMQGYK